MGGVEGRPLPRTPWPTPTNYPQPFRKGRLCTRTAPLHSSHFHFHFFLWPAWARDPSCRPPFASRKILSRKGLVGNGLAIFPQESARRNSVPHSTSGHGGLSAVLPGRSTHPVNTPPHSSAVTLGAGVVHPSSAGVCETDSRGQSHPGECRGNTRNRWPLGKVVVVLFLWSVSIYWGEGGSLEDRVECWMWSGAAGSDLSFPGRISQRLHLSEPASEADL